MRKGVNTFGHALAKAADYPAEALTSSPMLHLESTGRLEIEGCMGILDLDEVKVKLDMGSFVLTVIGSEMVIKNLSSRAMTVEGVIHTLSFEEAKQ